MQFWYLTVIKLFDSDNFIVLTDVCIEALTLERNVQQSTRIDHWSECLFEKKDSKMKYIRFHCYSLQFVTTLNSEKYLHNKIAQNTKVAPSTDIHFFRSLYHCKLFIIHFWDYCFRLKFCAVKHKLSLPNDAGFIVYLTAAYNIKVLTY